MVKDLRSHTRFVLKLNSEEKLSGICFLMIFIYSWAAKTSDALSSPLIQNLLTGVAIILLLVLILAISKSIQVTSNKAIIAIIIIAYLAVNLLYVYGSAKIARGLTTIFCLVILFQSEAVQARAFLLLKKTVAVSCVIGMVCGLLLLFGVHGSILGDPHSSGRQYISYLMVYFCRTKGFWRFCGFYNEPGALATFSAMFLCADSLDFKKKENIALLVGGILSFSISFYVILGLFAMMKYATNWRKWLLIGIAACAYFFVLPNIHTGNLAIDVVLQRLTFDGESLAGDNRTNYVLERLYEETLHSRYFIWGRKLGYANQMSMFSVNMVGPSIKTYIIDLGVIGTILLFIPLCIAELRRSRGNKIGILFIIITFINLYQRSYLLHNFSYFAVFICGLSYIIHYIGCDRTTNVRSKAVET